MNFLYPLFFAGILAVSLPIILHMIRRHTRKRITFSSLMFLRTTIPRFKNRSKPENLLLLILRCLIICLLALAFARPFIEKPAESTTESLGKRVVLLIDTSASMHRENLWTQAIEQAQSALEELEPTDRLCLMSFDKNTQTIMDFDAWSELEPDQREAIVVEQMSELSPTWSSTNLGNALLTAAEAIEDDEINDKLLINDRQIVLISDLQEGSDLDALQTYEWPEKTELIFKPVNAKQTTNAAMQVLTSNNYLTQSDPNEKIRVRVSNSSDAVNEQFLLSFADSGDNPIPVYVPPGQSTVTELPSASNNTKERKLVLSGDGQDYDNTLYLAPSLERQVNILYLGNDNVKDPKQMLYYINLAFAQTDSLKFNVISRTTNSELIQKDVDNANFIIITDTLNSDQIRNLKGKLESGNTILVAMKSPEQISVISELSGINQLNAAEAKVDDYTMFGSIEYDHPIFSLFSDPRYGDFSKIHFWEYRQVDLDDIQQARILARYDNDDPALFEIPVEQGSLLVLTSGWNPSDSEFARSSKFVPLLYSILEYNGVLNGQQSQYFVGDPILIPQVLTLGADNLKIIKPDKTEIPLDSDQEIFEQTDIPGFYTVQTSKGNQLFAVNIPALEYRTAPLPIEDIESYGVEFKDSDLKSSEKTERVKASQTFAELEYQQKYWRWIFVALFILILLEIWLGGWLTRPSVLTQGD